MSTGLQQEKEGPLYTTEALGDEDAGVIAIEIYDQREGFDKDELENLAERDDFESENVEQAYNSLKFEYGESVAEEFLDQYHSSRSVTDLLTGSRHSSKTII